jgi:hypothetical protein
MSEVEFEVEGYRKPLLVEDVPLPEGGDFNLSILEPEYKAQQLAAAEENRRRKRMDRVMLYARMKDDPAYRAVVYEKCKRSCQFFIDHFVFTYDDRADAGVVPMILYDFQIDKIIEPYEQLCNTQAPDRITIGVAKSRAIGYTWVSLAARVWRWLFHDNWSILIGGESRDDVDDGGQAATQQSLFGKIRFILKELPGFVTDDLLGPNWRKDQYNARNRLVNPMKPRNVLHGKQMGAMFGRGRRYSEVWADEVAFCEEMEDADVSLRQTTNRFTFGSTPKGKGNFFYQAMHGGLKFQRYYIWWAENPYLNIDWYNVQREHSSDDDIAQELDISFERSAGGRVLHEVKLDSWFLPTAKFDPALPIHVVMDPGWSDNFAAIWCQWDDSNQQGRVIDFVCTARKTVDWIVPFILGDIPSRTAAGEPWPHEYNDTEKRIIERHKEWLWHAGGDDFMEVFGDEAGNAGNVVTGSSAWDELYRYGITVHGIKIKNDKEAIRRLNLMLRHIRFSDELLTQRSGPRDESPTMAEVVTQWRYPSRRKNSTSANEKPVHNVYSHGGDCLKMWADLLDIPAATEMPVGAGKVIRRQRSGTTEPSDIEAKGIWRD